MDNTKDLKVAIVCDWLTTIGGAERVVYELHRLLPNAPIYTSQYDPSKIDWFKDADVRTTMLQHLPKGLKKFLPLLRAMSFGQLNLKEYDLVISSSGAEAKGVKVRSDAIHISYCHAPTHYYWSRYHEYMKEPGFGKFNALARFGLRTLVKPMRQWDYKAAQRPTYLIANSTHIQSEIKKYYNRDSYVVFPPVDTERFATPTPLQRSGLVIAGRQTPYKRIDLAVEACTTMSVPLTVIGDGPDHQRLVDMAGPRINFVTRATDQEVARYFQTASAFIFPGLDDFGIVAVEAMAAGTPVIAYRAGGALDYIEEGVTGQFFHEQTPVSLIRTLENFQPSRYNPQTIQQYARRYSVEAFRTNIMTFINKVLAEHKAQ